MFQFVDIIGKPKVTYRSDYLIGKILTDFIRHRLKVYRMGPSYLYQVENEIKTAVNLGYEFKTINMVKG